MVLPHTQDETQNKPKWTQGNFWKMLAMSIILILMIISWVFANAQIHHIVHIKHMQFFVYELNKAVKKS